MTCSEAVGGTLGNAKGQIDTLANTVPKMEEFSVGETRDVAQALNGLLGDALRHTEQCGGLGRHGG